MLIPANQLFSSYKMLKEIFPLIGLGFVGFGCAHSMAHTLGAVYDTPHGVACAMMLPIVMEYNQECTR